MKRCTLFQSLLEGWAYVNTGREKRGSGYVFRSIREEKRSGTESEATFAGLFKIENVAMATKNEG